MYPRYTLPQVHPWYPHLAHAPHPFLPPWEQSKLLENRAPRAPLPPFRGRNAPVKPRALKQMQPPLPAVKKQEGDANQKANGDIGKGNNGSSSTSLSATPTQAKPQKNIWSPEPSKVFTPDPSKSIWSVSPLQLSSMMLQARCGRQAPVAFKLLQASVATNQLTHDIDGYSSDEGSGDETDDEEIPMFARFHALPSLHEYPCDGHQDVLSLPHCTTQSVHPSHGNDAPPLNFRLLFSVPTPPSSNQREDQFANSSSSNAVPSYSGNNKRPPHMEWWPGDWKCNKCGNHNFSYRGLCKRCREGHFEEADFVCQVPSA